MPGVKTISKMNQDMKTVCESGAACHVGAFYYLHSTDVEPVKIDQNSDEYKVVLLCAGVYLHIVAPGSTLIQSPAFINTPDKASAEFGDWVAECRGYTGAMESRVSCGLAEVMGKFALGLLGIVGVETLKIEYHQIPNSDEVDKKSDLGSDQGSQESFC